MVGAQYAAAGLARRVETTLELLERCGLDFAERDDFVMAHEGELFTRRAVWLQQRSAAALPRVGALIAGGHHLRPLVAAVPAPQPDLDLAGTVVERADLEGKAFFFLTAAAFCGKG